MAGTSIVRANPYTNVQTRMTRNGRSAVSIGYTSRDGGRTGVTMLTRAHRNRSGSTIRVRTTTVARVRTSRAQTNADRMAVHRKAQPGKGALAKAGYRQVRTGRGKGGWVNSRTQYTTYKRVKPAKVARRTSRFAGARGNGKPPQLSRAQRASIARGRRRDSRGKFR